MHPRSICWLLAALSLLAVEAHADELLVDPTKAQPDADSDVLWYDIDLLGVEGRAWTETKARFDRLPAKAEGAVRAAVWGLSRNSAGMLVRFQTDATTIHARWTLISSNLAMPHMPATGVSGLDLYARDAAGQWRWLAVGQPKQFPDNRVALVSGLPEGNREYCLYLPLYNGVSAVDIGLPKAAKMQRLPRPADRKPLVFYGTSITQGGCASRPGMLHTAILGRRLDRPIINLGFSGNGKMEPEVTALLNELEVAVYVIDCLPNMLPEEVQQRVEPLVTTLRQAHPTTPILLVEDRNYTDSFLVASKRERNEKSQAELRAAFERLKDAGVPALFYLDGAKLLGDDGEATVDSSHPTDLGFLRMADAFEPVLRTILEGAE